MPPKRKQKPKGKAAAPSKKKAKSKSKAKATAPRAAEDGQAAAAAAAAAEQPFEPPQVLIYEYTAAENETPKIIADTLKVSLDELIQINKPYYPGLKPNARLQEGTILEVPGTAHAAPTPASDPQQPAASAAAASAASVALPPAVAAAAAPAPAPPPKKRSHHKRKEWKVGERVEARYPPDGNYYECTIAEVGPKEYTVDWTEADDESHIYRQVPRADVRKYRAPTKAERREEAWMGETYLTADDETPKHVSKRLGVMLSELLNLNEKLYEGLTATSKLMAGTMLRVPPRMDGMPRPAEGSMLTSDLVQTEKIEKLLKKRTTASGATEFLVKLGTRSYIHCELSSTSRFDVDITQLKFKLKRFSQQSGRIDEDQRAEEAAYLQGAQEIKRIVADKCLMGK